MRKLKVAFFLCACLVLFAAGLVHAQSAEESAARSAQGAGQYRLAFTHYMAAWNEALAAYDRNQSPANDQTLDRIRLAMFLVVRRLDPPPAIPDGAIALEGRAEAAIKAAQSPRDYNDANEAYRLAIRQAPWVPRLYFNRAVVGEKMGDWQGAIVNLTYYLQAAPDAEDATEVRKKIGGLQYLVEKDTAAKTAAQAAADHQAQAVQQVTSDLSGTWIENAGNRFQYVVTTNGSQIELLWTAVDWGQGWRKALSLSRFRGTVQGLQITGQSEVENARNVSSPGDGTFNSGAFTGTISSDGRTITIRYPFRNYTAQLVLTR